MTTVGREALHALARLQTDELRESRKSVASGSPLIGHHHHTARNRNNPVSYSWQNGGPITLASDNTTKSDANQ
jgi:hypothetical protein